MDTDGGLTPRAENQFICAPPQPEALFPMPGVKVPAMIAITGTLIERHYDGPDRAYVVSATPMFKS
ncbi:hypothetical protein A9Q94_00915 [Rhodobacterales bacterium 56_14_T64]|nr:hypothetical protein A9Q94_00915 [Rhodobacterales bacterium 56_14_T64]